MSAVADMSPLQDAHSQPCLEDCQAAVFKTEAAVVAILVSVALIFALCMLTTLSTPTRFAKAKES